MLCEAPQPTGPGPGPFYIGVGNATPIGRDLLLTADHLMAFYSGPGTYALGTYSVDVLDALRLGTEDLAVMRVGNPWWAGWYELATEQPAAGSAEYLKASRGPIINGITGSVGSRDFAWTSAVRGLVWGKVRCTGSTAILMTTQWTRSDLDPHLGCIVSGDSGSPTFAYNAAGRLAIAAVTSTGGAPNPANESTVRSSSAQQCWSAARRALIEAFTGPLIPYELTRGIRRGTRMAASNRRRSMLSR